MTLVLDAGAFLAVERTSRPLAALIKAELVAGRPPLTHGGVVGQVWRGGSGRQAPVARLLAGTEVVGLDESLGRLSGVLLGEAGGADVIDSALVLLAVDGDIVVTSDPADLTTLAEATGTHLELLPV